MGSVAKSSRTAEESLTAVRSADKSYSACSFFALFMDLLRSSALCDVGTHYSSAQKKRLPEGSLQRRDYSSFTRNDSLSCVMTPQSFSSFSPMLFADWQHFWLWQTFQRYFNSAPCFTLRSNSYFTVGTSTSSKRSSAIRIFWLPAPQW